MAGLCVLVAGAVVASSAFAPEGGVPTIAEFKTAYRAAFDRQAEATRALKVEFHRDIESLRIDGGNAGVKKTPELIEKEKEIERRVLAMNRMNKFDMTYYRSGDRERLDLKSVHPDTKGESLRSIVIGGDGSFAVSRMPGASAFQLEFFEKAPGRARDDLVQGLSFVDGARFLGASYAPDMLLGPSFTVTAIRGEKGRDSAGSPVDLLSVDVKRIKPPAPSRVPRHLVKGTITLEPGRDYRISRFVLVTNDENVATGTFEYAETPAGQGQIPSRFVHDIRKQGIDYTRVETFTTKHVSFDRPADGLFTTGSFGIGTEKPGASPLLPILAILAGSVLIAFGIVIHRGRAFSKRRHKLSAAGA